MKQNLHEIADMLLLNGTLTKCPGLIHGKMGIAVFFFHYARYTGNTLFMSYALDLIVEIQKQIHINSPADYRRGIAGIGVGIDYLIRNNFLDAEDDIFEDLDQRMYRAVMYDPWLDFSLYDGLMGFGRYWIARLGQQSAFVLAQECLTYIIKLIEKKQSVICAEEQKDVYYFLYDLYKITAGNLHTGFLESFWVQSEAILSNYFYLGGSSVANITRMSPNKYHYNNPLQDEFDRVIDQIPNLDMSKYPVNMGLFTGYAGEGLLRLAVLDPTIVSWIRLL